MIKVILYDFTGVVVTGGHKKLSQQLAEKYNLKPEEIYAVIYKKYWEKFCLNKISEEEAFQGSIDELNLNLTWQEMVKMYLKTHKINSPMVAYIKKLRLQYKTVLLTKNIKHYLDWERKEFALDQLFDDIINTQEINLPKASVKTLQYVCDRFQVKPEEILYVDDQEENLVEAKRLGVHTVLYQTFAQVKKEFEEILDSFG